MGFLDSLLRQGAKRLISEVTDAAIDAVKDEIISNRDKKDESNVNTMRVAASTAKADDSVPAGYESVAEEDVEVKLRTVFAKEFPQYEICENVSPTTLGGTGKFMDYTFGVYENGVPKLFIMVVSGNDCALRTYRWSKEEAQRAGVTLINFVAAFENRIDYIINRLHQYL
ncbi:MAG: hypothetical protein E7291_04245 [Lachnospiraceae bacterium]|nr:hypothetical protein [Lachnospiraceae bacterium]